MHVTRAGRWQEQPVSRTLDAGLCTEKTHPCSLEIICMKTGCTRLHLHRVTANLGRQTEATFKWHT
jgi:hypothetical protein